MHNSVNVACGPASTSTSSRPLIWPSFLSVSVSASLSSAAVFATTMQDPFFKSKLVAVGLSFFTAGAAGTITFTSNHLALSPSVPKGGAVEIIYRNHKQGRNFFVPACFISTGVFLYIARKSAGSFYESPYTYAALFNFLPLPFTFAVMVPGVIRKFIAAFDKAGAAGSVALLGGENEVEKLCRKYGWLNLVRVAMLSIGGFIGLDAALRGV